jgi:thioester reductase-like protein
LGIWCKLLDVSTEELSTLDSLFEVGGEGYVYSMDNLHFKSLALEMDYIWCQSQFDRSLYASLKESNVKRTQEILRLATTSGFVKTKVKPVHYISTNGISPI